MDPLCRLPLPGVPWNCANGCSCIAVSAFDRSSPVAVYIPCRRDAHETENRFRVEWKRRRTDLFDLMVTFLVTVAQKSKGQSKSDRP
jgi:hypothetical protein